jgi:hypothetical protein
MSIIDLSWNENLRNRHNSPLLPRSIRGLIIGKSGCGKTNLIMNLLLRDGFLDYNMLKVFGKSLFQNEYKIIKEAFQYGIPKEYIVQLFAMRDEILRIVKIQLRYCNLYPMIYHKSLPYSVSSLRVLVMCQTLQILTRHVKT